jgi:hypothetical protein
LHRVEVGSTVELSEVHVASILKIDWVEWVTWFCALFNDT